MSQESNWFMVPFRASKREAMVAAMTLSLITLVFPIAVEHLVTVIDYRCYP